MAFAVLNCKMLPAIITQIILHRQQVVLRATRKSLSNVDDFHKRDFILWNWFYFTVWANYCITVSNVNLVAVNQIKLQTSQFLMKP